MGGSRWPGRRREGAPPGEIGTFALAAFGGGSNGIFGRTGEGGPSSGPDDAPRRAFGVRRHDAAPSGDSRRDSRSAGATCRTRESGVVPPHSKLAKAASCRRPQIVSARRWMTTERSARSTCPPGNRPRSRSCRWDRIGRSTGRRCARSRRRPASCSRREYSPGTGWPGRNTGCTRRASGRPPPRGRSEISAAKQSVVGA